MKEGLKGLVKVNDTPETVCNLCQSKAQDMLYDVHSFSVMRCRNCGLVFSSRLSLSDEEFYAIYEDEICEKSQYKIRFWEEFLSHFQKKYSDSIGQKTLLDIGCGEGLFLNIARSMGWKAEGVEPSVAASKRANELHNLPVFNGTLEEANFPSSHFDVIFMWDVIEHLKNPAVTINEINRILKPGGLLLVYTPNYSSLVYIVARFLYKLSIKSFLKNLHTPKHVYFFTRRTLNQLLNKHNFGIKEVTSGPLTAASVRKIEKIGSGIIELLGKLLRRPYRILVIGQKSY